MHRSRTVLILCVLLTLDACQHAAPDSELSALELASRASESEVAGRQCPRGRVQVCTGMTVGAPMHCGCVSEAFVDPLLRR